MEGVATAVVDAHVITLVESLKTEFLRVAAHELRTPLTSIGTFAHMLELGSLEPAEQREAVAAIRRNAERMQVLVADLLLLAQLESGETRLGAEPVDVAALLVAACEVADLRIEPGGTPAPPPRVDGDEALLWQLLDTTVGVVVAAADHGAPVRVVSAVRREPTAPEPAPVRQQWTVTVSTATAEPASLERLLSTRLPHPDAEGEHRTGTLALMLAREIAARHGGRLTSSVDANGLTVHLELPVQGI